MFLLPFLPFAILGGLALWTFGSKPTPAAQPVVPPVQPPTPWPTYGGYNPYTYVPPE